MMLLLWGAVMVLIGVALAVLTRGAPRVLSLAAIVVAAVSIAINVLLTPMLFDQLGGGVTGLLLAILNMGRDVVVLALFIAAAALASRVPTPVERTGAPR